MRDGLTEREAEIIRQLLTKRGITEYEIIEEVGEGKQLPGSTYSGEIESISGLVVTVTAAYVFWLDWGGDTYILDNWREIPFDRWGAAKDKILEAQQRLRQNRMNLSLPHHKYIMRWGNQS